MTIEEKKMLCHGCRDDYYNRPGNTPNGQCYSLEKAKVVQRTKVGWWQNSPYTWQPQETLSCNHCPGTYAWIDANDVRIKKAK